jgi:hypothetical protein
MLMKKTNMGVAETAGDKMEIKTEGLNGIKSPLYSLEL